MAKSGSDAPEENLEDIKKYGFDLYPERRSEKESVSLVREVYREKDKMDCEKVVYDAIKRNPLIQVLLGALKRKGCPIDLRRNFACESCSSEVMGGFDQEYNQIVVCTDQVHRAEPILIHELIHMYDYCTANTDFKNLDHLACTEIRAANMTHCSFLNSFISNQSSLLNIKKTHQYCVKMKAAESMMLSRNLTFEQALDRILKVFDRCYNDLEPLGRRVRRNSMDPLMAYNEALQIGICDEFEGEL